MFLTKHGYIGFIQILTYKLWLTKYARLNEIILLSKFELYNSMSLFVSALYSLTTKAK